MKEQTQDDVSMTIVLAGNRREFVEWCRRNHRNSKDNSIVFATNSSDLKRRLLGITGPLQVEKVGTYYRKRDLAEIEREIEYIQAIQE